MAGFATLTRVAVAVGVGQAVTLDVGMDVEKVAVRMDVAPPIPGFNAATPEISSTIETRRVAERISQTATPMARSITA